MTTKPALKENYVEYLEGTLPIILSAPHGGTHEPEGIIKRTSGVFEHDDFTKELTQEIAEAFFKLTHQYPHMVTMNLSREIVDANRKKEEAISEDKKSEQAYESFHRFIATAKQQVATQHQKGLYFDIHGQSHQHGCIEFGYLLHNSLLQMSDEEIFIYQNLSSIRKLSNFSSYSFSEQLRGSVSMSGFMENLGYGSIPSKTTPYEENNEYFEGAHNTVRYTSLDEDNVSPIQVEFPYKNCRDTKENREKLAMAFAKSVLKFINVHYGMDLKKVS